MQKITPFLWFDTQAEEAAKFYVSIFKKSKILSVTHYPEGMPGPAGSVMTVDFMMNGQKFTALNGGPIYKFTEAVSFLVPCETQKEIDYYWKKLTARGGQEIQCGWLRDRYGLSWQVAPKALLKLIESKDKKKVERVMKVMVTMVKIDLKAILEAAKAK